ncbi:MAG: WGR domain-containing protein [Myxococcales bacterium]|nr:WGR domain-containing protein [Myxococcales bacterium]
MTRDASLEAASRFYGLALDEIFAQACDENLTLQQGALVHAHLSRNYSYFGAIDKTLSGFVILDDTGDNYTLADVRGAGQVFWQDHETRELYLEFDSVADYLECQREIAQAEAAAASGDADDDDGDGDDSDGDGDVDSDAIKAGYRPDALRLGDRVVPTHTLAERYQWLVWTLAQPLTRDGKPIQSVRELVGTGLGLYEQAFPDDEALAAAFRGERSHLADDPHLAIYWLLHAAVRCEPERLAAVLEAIEPTRARWPELLSAFVSALSSLGVDGALDVVPDFRARRGLLALVRANAAAKAGDQSAALDDYLLSLRMDPREAGFSKALPIARALDEGEKALAPRVRETLSALGGLHDGAPAVALLRAKLDAVDGADYSAYADVVAKAAADAATIADPMQALEVLWPIHTLVRDGEAMSALAERLYAFDSYHRRVLKICQRAQLLGKHARFGNAVSLAERVALAEASMAPLGALLETPDQLDEIVAGIDSAALRDVVARRVLMRVDLFESAAPVLWAFDALLAARDDDGDVDSDERASLLARGLLGAKHAAQKQLLERVGAAIDAPDHPLLDVLFRVLERATQGIDEDDFGASYMLGKLLESVIALVSPHAAAERVYARLLALARGPGRKLPETLVNTLFNPFNKEGAYLVDRIDDAQAQQGARLLIDLRQHENTHVANGAGHQLYRFNHPGAAEVCIDALARFGASNAEAKARGERDKLAEDIVANLYAALRGMARGASEHPGRDKARDAILERLYSERASYWRLGNAISELGDPAETHQRVMALLAARPDADAAAAYAAALAHFIKQAPPLAHLGEVVASWPLPDAAPARARFKYVLLEAARAALEAKAHDAVRACCAAAGRISEAPYSPYHSVDRGNDFVDPFDPAGAEDNAELRAQLARVLSGEADAAAASARERAAARRGKGKPRARISDEELGTLAGVTVGRRLFSEKLAKTIWFRDSDGRAHYFDGFEVVEPPFRFVDDVKMGKAAGKAFFAGIERPDERLMLWSKRGADFIEWTRYDKRLVLRQGANNGGFDMICVEARDAEQAAAIVDSARASIPRGYRETGAFYVPGCGAVVRTFYTPNADGSYNSDGRQLEAVLDGALSWGRKDLGSDAAAQAEVDAMESACLRAGGYVSCIEWMDRLRRAEDLDLVAWMQKRIRQDARSAAWHLAALSDIARYLEAHGLDALFVGDDGARELEVELLPPAVQADIDALAATLARPLPEPLVTLWRQHGGARWRCGARSGELLSPRGVLEQRARARAHGERWLSKLPEASRAQAAALYGALYAVTLADGELDTLMADAERSDDRVFTKAGYAPNDMWWEKAFGWMLATGLLSDFCEALVARAPTLRLLWHGQRYDAAQPHALYALDDRRWEVRFDEAAMMLATRSGKVGKPGKVSIKRFDDAVKARKAYDKALASSEKKGYSPAAR